MDFLIEKVIDAVLEASGLKEKIGRSEKVIRLKKRFKLDSVESLAEFDDVYAYAVVEYAFDEIGQLKPPALIEFFKRKDVRDVFQTAYRQNDRVDWLNKGQEIAQFQLGGQLTHLDPRQELGIFATVFVSVVQQTQSPKEVRQEQQITYIHRQLEGMAEQQRLTLEAVNQNVGQLMGSEQSLLPAAAQESKAAGLAHEIGEWFKVLGYDRDPDYEVWEAGYFEWAIDFPVTRRKMSRTLVRGVAGEVDMADLQAFAQAIDSAGADEG
ncbi:MAG: hypothetical protein AAFR25_05200 [Cyanobacteria bacterium J06629_19]